MKASKTKALRGGSLTKSKQSLFIDVFFPSLKYAKKERKRVKIGKIRKHVLFELPIPISSIADGLIFANSHFSKISRGLIFAKSPKIREIAKFNPRKVQEQR